MTFDEYKFIVKKYCKGWKPLLDEDYELNYHYEKGLYKTFSSNIKTHKMEKVEGKGLTDLTLIEFENFREIYQALKKCYKEQIKIESIQDDFE